MSHCRNRLSRWSMALLVSGVVVWACASGRAADAIGNFSVIHVTDGVPVKTFLLAATCEGSSPYFPGWSMPLADVPTPTCVEGTNVTIGQADFPDGSTTFMQTSFPLPSDWTGAIGLGLQWKSSATSGNVVWQVQTACSAAGESIDPSWNTAQTITDATQGTTNRLNTASLSSVTTTGCAAGEWMFWKILRDPSHASDTLGATASLLSAEWTYRRAL